VIPILRNKAKGNTMSHSTNIRTTTSYNRCLAFLCIICYLSSWTSEHKRLRDCTSVESTKIISLFFFVIVEDTIAVVPTLQGINLDIRRDCTPQRINEPAFRYVRFEQKRARICLRAVRCVDSFNLPQFMTVGIYVGAAVRF